MASCSTPSLRVHVIKSSSRCRTAARSLNSRSRCPMSVLLRARRSASTLQTSGTGAVMMSWWKIPKESLLRCSGSKRNWSKPCTRGLSSRSSKIPGNYLERRSIFVHYLKLLKVFKLTIKEIPEVLQVGEPFKAKV